MMVRSRIPGGVMTANQWRVFDELASAVRQQHAAHHHAPDHPVSRRCETNLRAVIKGINESLLSTLAACGDVNRNVLAPPTPAYTKAREQVYARLRSRWRMALAPQTRAYHAIWIDGVQLNLDDAGEQEFRGPALRQNLSAAQIQGRLRHSAGERPGRFHQLTSASLPSWKTTSSSATTSRVGGGMGRSHGNEADLSAPGGCARIFHAGQTRGRGESRADDSPRFRRPHRPQARALEICRRRNAAWTGRARKSRNAPASSSRPRKPYQFTTTADLLGWHKAVDGKLVSRPVRRNRPREGRDGTN